MLRELAASSAGTSEALGAVLAAASAVAYDAGYIIEKKALGALVDPADRIGVLLRRAVRSNLWLTGFVIMIAALALQVLALTLAPVSVVQPILAGGLVALAAVSSMFTGERLEPRHKAALGLVLLAVLAVALSAKRSSQAVSPVSVRAMVVVLAAGSLLAGAAAVIALARSRSRSAPGGTGRGSAPPGRPDMDRHRLVALALSAGIFYGLGALAEKAVAERLSHSGLVSGGLSSLTSAYPWLFVAVTAAGLVAFQVGLADFPVSLIASLTNIASTACALLGARIVFGETVLAPGGWAVLRAAGLVCGAGAVILLWMPASRHYSPARDPT
ncbi:MAG: hypothetical protein ACP5P1_10305 [Acidimicrobiales bacterium]